MIDRFASPAALAALTVLPPLAWASFRWQGAAIRFSDVRLVLSAGRSLRLRLRWVVPVLRLAALALLIVAVARPQRQTGMTPISSEGIAIQLVIDRSGSMAEPFASGDGSETSLTKLDAVKKLLRQFVLGDGHDLKGRSGDQLGLVTFARFADTACPLSRSPKMLVQLAEQTRVAQERAESGTAIGDALALAAARLKAIDDDPRQSAEARTDAPRRAKAKSRIIVLLTDGQNNAGDVDPMQAAEVAKSWGFRVYTIGLAGAARAGDPFSAFRQADGVDEGTLRRIAEMTGGRYFAASDAATLHDVYTTIDTLEKTTLSAPESATYAELFAPLAASSLLALAADLLLGRTVLRSLP